jgi:O-antigen/teichoic acid export membrane protein
MRRFFVKNILFVIAVNVLVKPIWVFFIDRNVQNTVPGGSYGTYQALFNVSIIFQIILDFGISSYNSRNIAQNPDKLPVIFPAMLSARLVLIIVYVVLAYLLGYAFGYRGWELRLLVGVLLMQALNALVSFIRSNVAALQKFIIDGILSVTDRLLAIAICGFLLLYPPTARHFKIHWFVLTQVFSYLVSAVLGYLVLKRIARVKLRFSFDAAAIYKIIKHTFPYALLIFLMSVYNRADAIMIERMCADGKDQAGIWAAAFRMLDMVNIFGLMFATVLLPFFGRMLSQKNDVQPIVKLCVNVMLPFSFMVAVAAVFFSNDIVYLLYHKNPVYQEAGNAVKFDTVFAILMASFPAWCLMYVYSTLLTANGSLKTLNIIAFAGVIINLSLNFYLIPHYKAVGGAVTSFITQTSLALTFVVFAARIIKLPFNPRWAAAHVGYLLFTVALAYATIRFLGQASWLLQLAFFGAVCVAFMFVFRFVTVHSVKQLMNVKSKVP